MQPCDNGRRNGASAVSATLLLCRRAAGVAFTAAMVALGCCEAAEAAIPGLQALTTFTGDWIGLLQAIAVIFAVSIFFAGLFLLGSNRGAGVVLMVVAIMIGIGAGFSRQIAQYAFGLGGAQVTI